MCATGDLGHTMMEGLVAFGVGIGVFATACGGIALYIKSKVEEEQRTCLWNRIVFERSMPARFR